MMTGPAPETAQPQTAPPRITVVVPVYNEEDNLRPLAEEITRAMARVTTESLPAESTECAGSWELLFVDDGSTDGSLAVIRELAAESPYIRYIALEANRGQSAAFAAGFRDAAGTLIITLDADLQNDPADIPAMLALYGRDGTNMVVGWRAHRKDTLAKRLASRFGNAVRNWISRDTIKDTGCSLKVMRRDMLLTLPVFTGVHRFYPALMRLEGAVIAEVKVNHRPRRAGVSKYGIWDRARKTCLDLLAVRWLQSRHVSYRIKERSS